MRKHVETFHAKKGCKLAIVFFKPIWGCFQNRNLARKRPLLFTWKRIHSTLYFILLEKPLRGFSKGSVFSQAYGPGPGPVLGRCTKQWAVSENSKTGWKYCNDGCFQALQTGKLRYTLDRILNIYIYISFKRKVERYLSTFSFSMINSNFLELRVLHDISISQNLLDSACVENTGEPSVCFFLGSFVGFFRISNFVFTL